MKPTELVEPRQALEPRETSEAEAAQIARLLRRQEAALLANERDRRRWSRPVWRLWRLCGNLLCAPRRLVTALRMPPDQC